MLSIPTSTEGERNKPISTRRRMKLRPSSYQRRLNAAKNASSPWCTTTSTSTSTTSRDSKWDGLNLWSCDERAWDNDLCGLCRNKLTDACIECEGREQDDMFSKLVLSANRYQHAPTKVCPRAMGQCSHSYHWHCIAKWLKAKNQCPIDHVEWKYEKVE